MNPLRILIVEDELIIAETIKEMAEELGHSPVEVAGNVREAHQLLKEQRFDLALLDINLNDPEGNGIDVGNHIQQNYATPFVFITAYPDAKYLEMAKSLSPQGYVLKPINKDRLYVAIELAMDNARHQKDHNRPTAELQGLFQDSFFVKDGIYIHKIEFDAILYLKSEGNYTEIITQQKTYLIRSLLKQIIDKLPENYFMRIHRSYIINVKKITLISPSEVTLGSNTILPIGETYRKELQDFVERF